MVLLLLLREVVDACVQHVAAHFLEHRECAEVVLRSLRTPSRTPWRVAHHLAHSQVDRAAVVARGEADEDLDEH